MRKLFFNYVALGETVMSTVIENYVISCQHVFFSSDECSKKCRKSSAHNIKVIEKKIGKDNFHGFLPHSKISGMELLGKMKVLARDNKYNIGSVSFDERGTRKIWSLVELSTDMKDNLEFEYESEQLIQNVCDYDILEYSEEVFECLKTFLDERLSRLTKSQRMVLELRFGLNGAPCMSYMEIAKKYFYNDLHKVIYLNRCALLYLF